MGASSKKHSKMITKGKSSKAGVKTTKNNNNQNTSSTNTNTTNTNTNTSTNTMQGTRVCIKNLPKTTTDDELKDFLKLNATISLQITDCKVLHTADGKRSRRIAFVGFRSIEMTRHVLERFPKTYMRSSRLIVEPAAASASSTSTSSPSPTTTTLADKKYKHKMGQQQHHGTTTTTDGTERRELSSSSSSSSKQSNNNKVKEQQLQDSSSTSKDRVALQKEEFLSLMGVGKSSTKNGKDTKFWANDDTMVPMVQEEEPMKEKEKDQDKMKDDVSTSSSSSSSDDSDEEKDDVDPLRPNNKDNKKVQIKNSTMSDMDFLRSKQSLVEELKEDDDDDDDDDVDGGGGGDDGGVANPANSDSDSSSSDSDDDDDDDDETKPIKLEETKDHTILENNNDKNDGGKDGDGNDDNDDDDLTSSKRLFIRNLPFSTTEEELREFIETCGWSKGDEKQLQVTECHIPVDDQRRNKGFAFVSLSSTDDAWKARTELDKHDFQGRLLHILPARPPPQQRVQYSEEELANLTWKQRQELVRKQGDIASSGDGTGKTGWSASFVRSDTVVDHLADRLGLRNAKGELLNVKDGLSSGDAAVRLALGETQIIQENRDYFASHGIDMDALVSVKPSNQSKGNGSDKKNQQISSGKRSTSSFLVKNLPYDTTVDELTKLFHFGSVVEGEDDSFRVLLPPSRTIALVEYNHSSDAKKAFRKLAYRRFKHVPIYLEWAPLAAGTSKTADNVTAQGGDAKLGHDGDGVSRTLGKQQVQEKVVEEEDNPEDEVDEGAGTSTTIYVKNLNFRTTEDELREVFERHGRVRAVKIPQKVAPMAHGGDGEVQSMSMGYGFVEMESSSLVQLALKKLQGKLVDGHALELKISNNSNNNRSNMSDVKKSKKEKNPTKLLVKNVPFQATRKELVKLFGSFGQLRTVRCPKKFDGTHRGFAFVEYLASKDAVESMSALSRTHLYGRHLVLDWASNADQEDKEAAELREKAKRPMGIDTTKRVNKKIRFD